MSTTKAVGGRVRRRYGAAERERLVRAQAASGLSKLAFCRREGIGPGTFYRWTGAAAAAARGPAFAEVELPACAQAEVEVLLPNGVRIGIRHRGGRGDLVALVRGVAGC